MRVNKWGIGVVLTAAVLLTGCTGTGTDEEPSDSKPSTSSEESSAPASDCPKLSDGATVDMAELGVCAAERMQDSQGYAATTFSMGSATVIRYNPKEKEMSVESGIGSLITIGGDAWVKSGGGEWQISDPESSDPTIAALSQSAAQSMKTDPLASAAAVTGEYEVTGTDERLGQTVYLVSGTTEQQGVNVDATFEITEDYVILASKTSAETADSSVQFELEITEWDKKQEIVAPL